MCRGTAAGGEPRCRPGPGPAGAWGGAAGGRLARPNRTGARLRRWLALGPGGGGGSRHAGASAPGTWRQGAACGSASKVRRSVFREEAKACLME